MNNLNTSTTNNIPMSDGEDPLMEFDFYVYGKVPEQVEGAEIVKVERVFGEWHRLTLRFPKNKFKEVVEALRKSGSKLASSALY